MKNDVDVLRIELELDQYDEQLLKSVVIDLLTMGQDPDLSPIQKGLLDNFVDKISSACVAGHTEREARLAEMN